MDWIYTFFDKSQIKPNQTEKQQIDLGWINLYLINKCTKILLKNI